MVDHGATPYFVLATIGGACAVTFIAFQVNSILGEQVERCASSWLVIWLAPSLPVIVFCDTLPRANAGAWSFDIYNDAAVAYPMRIRAVACAWTDGLGH